MNIIKKINLRKSHGFTLVELLVVLAIIGILATIILAVFSDMKARGRDSRRVSDLNALSKALALYLSINDAYPAIDGPPGIIIDGGAADTVTSDLKDADTLQSTIVDPNDNQVINGETFHYQYYSNNSDEYVITYCLETSLVQGKTIGCGNIITP